MVNLFPLRRFLLKVAGRRKAPFVFNTGRLANKWHFALFPLMGNSGVLTHTCELRRLDFLLCVSVDVTALKMFEEMGPE